MIEAKLQFLQGHMIDREKEFCIHREVIKNKTQTKLNMEGNEGGEGGDDFM